MSGPRGKSRRLSDAERVLWKQITRTIAPMRKSFAQELESEAEASAPAPIVAPPAPPRSAPKRPKSEAPPALAPLGRRAKQRVARGQDAIDGRLDLHGLTQAEAHDVLLRFLHTAQVRGARFVMVITGKGRGGEIGVLRRQVPLWLALAEFRALVVGFEEAHRTHGGEGALYLRVRRPRKDQL
jgi:DNA-nicking Smr family endonuclease